MFYEKKTMFREINEVKPYEKNLNKSSKSTTIKTVERDSLGRITKIVMNADDPNAFNFESLNEVLEVAEHI